MTNTNQNKNLITERVFKDDKTSIESIINKYLQTHIDNLAKGSYDRAEVKAISTEEREVA